MKFIILLLCIVCYHSFGYHNKVSSSFRCNSQLQASTWLSTSKQLNSKTLCFLTQTNDANNDKDNKPYLKHLCPSCSFVYDEEKGFKKRYPAGTRFEDIPVFMCPVCGARKEQFVVVSDSDSQESK